MSIKIVKNYGWCMHQEVWSYGSLIETIHEWLVNRDSGKKMQESCKGKIMVSM